MPWFYWTESIKKKVCRYVLQHYLGHFLRQKLQYDQLSVDLYNGSGCVQNVQLDVFAFNEVVQKVNAPIEILDGTVQSISVSIPWKTIFSESCVIEVRGIQLTIQPKYMSDNDLANMTDSFCSSFKNMTTSMQVAQECMRDAEKQEADTPMGGLDMFAQAIESIFRRIVLKFGEINLCFEHIVPSTNLGVGLRLSIKYFEYFDEDSDKENELAAQNQGKNAPVIENVAFSCKQFKISGVDISVYQFSGNKGFAELHQSCDFSIESMINPVLIAQLYGEQQVKLRIKQNDQLSGPKLDGELYLGNIAAFITPKQLHLLVDFVDGFINPSSGESNYTPDSFPSSVSPPECSNRSLNGKITNIHQKYEASHFNFDHDSSDFTPVESPTPKPKIVQFHPMAQEDSFSSDTFKSTVDHFKPDETIVAPNNKPKRRYSSNGGSDLNYSEIFRIQIKVVALSLAVLHVDPTNIGKSLSTKQQKTELKESSVDNDSYLFNLITNYFTDVRKAFVQCGLIELFQNRNLFTNAARKHDHLRILAGPLHVECERKTSSQKAVVSSTKVSASVGNAELLECLYNGETANSKKSCDCIELLVFPMFFENNLQSMHISTCSTQCVRLSLDISDTSEQLHTTIRLQLSDCKSEVDISIIDRISDLLYSFDTASKRSASTNASDNFAITPTTTLYDTDAVLFQKVLDESETKSNKLELDLTSTRMHVEFRFPIPDLRPEIQRRPWFERMLRDEILFLDIRDLDCQTCIVTSCDQNRKSIKCRFREMSASYAEEPRTKPTLFLRTCQDDLYHSEVDNDYDWPLVQIDFNKQNNTHQLLNNDDGKVQVDDSTLHFLPHYTWETEHENIPLFNSFYEPSDSRKPSPFSHRKVIHNGENVILPGDEEEIQDFVDHASATAKVAIVLNFPVVNVALPSKAFIENIYNRFGNDLLLWEPAAPQPNAPAKSEMHLIPPRLDLESQFFSTREHSSDSSHSKSAMHVSFMTDDDDTSMSFMSNNHTTIQNSFEKCQTQSFLSLSLNIGKGTLSLCSSIESENGDSQTGQIFIELSNGSLFTVSQYLGNPNLDYVCIQVESCHLYHKLGLVSIPVMEETGRGLNVPSYLNSILYPVNIGVVSAFENRTLTQSSNSPKLVTVVLKLEVEQGRAMKHCLVAALLNGLTLRHQFLPAGQSFLEQLIEIFNVEDTPVLGYEPPTFVTEVHFHVNDCALDYKPLNLSTRAVATISSFALSSNVTADAERSNLQIVMDNVNVYLSDNYSERYVDLRQNFVNVLSIALLELCLKLRSQPPTSKSKIIFPDLELIVSNSHIRMWSCADSTALLAALLRYIAENGDIVLCDDDDEEDEKTLSCNGEEDSKENGDERSSQCPTDKLSSNNLKASYEEHLEDLLADAVVDLDHGSTVIHSNRYNSNTHSDSGMMSEYEEDARSLSDFVLDGDDDFCIIDDFNTQSSKDEPKVEYLVEDKIVVLDNYFCPVSGRADQLKPPEHFPNAVLRYAVREMSCSWYIYGGNDFQVKEDDSSRWNKDRESHETYVKLTSEYAKKSPLHIDKKPGGLNRNYKVLMEFHVTKARFHHEIYCPESKYDSRTVLAVGNFEVHDRLQSSQINKFLYHFHNESSPKQSNADMLLVKALLVRAEQHKDPECRLLVSLQPLRLNIDQDALIFLTDYFANLASSVNDDANYPIDDGSTYGTAPSTFAEPRLEMNHQREDSSLKSNSYNNEPDQSNVLRPLFFNEFVFSPAVPIRLDYHGKHIAIEHGKIAGLLMGLGRLNCSQLKLQKIVHRHGLLGFDKLVNFALNEWAADIRNNQLPSILGGVGPMHSFVQLFQGVRDLVWLPVEQYRKDGRIVRGLQRGTSSFGTSTSMAMLELSNRMVGFVQSAAETACDIVSPAEVQKSRERYRNSWRGLEKQARRSRQPSDVREGFNNACSLLQHGFTDTAFSIARVAQKEHERKGLTGAVGGVIRLMPVTLVRPLAFTSEAAANVISGIRNQIEPDARREDEDKWRDSANGP